MSDPKDDSTIVAGRKPVKELLERRPDEISCVYFNQDLKTEPILILQRRCKKAGVTVKRVPARKLEQLAKGANHQGVLASVSPVSLRDLDDVLAEIASRREDVQQRMPLLVIPVHITDPHNLGAIVRSAVAFGASAVLLPDRKSARMDTLALKASAGTALRIPFARIGNVAQCVQQLKERGYWVAGLAGGGTTKMAEMDWNRPLAILVGSESDGLPESVERSCDFVVAIPMSPDVESLNASVAAGIILQAAGRGR